MLHALILLMTTAAATPDHASHTRRYALLISANRGNPDEPVLRFAESDMARVQEVLADVAGVPKDRIVALRQATADGVRDAFVHMHDRIAFEQNAGGESILFVYYSGHADTQAMHLNNTNLMWSDLLKMTRKVDTTARVMVIDACRSGAITELKGVARRGEMASPLLQDVPSGLAIITSASAGEIAQESRNLQGSFFTHHFVAAMRGAGDINHDGAISLSEAFDYASMQTSSSTAATWLGVQHAAYRFQLQGAKDLTLTAPAVQRAGGTISLPEPGVYVFREEAAGGAVALEASVGSGERVVRLPFGDYDVRRRTTTHLYHAKISLTHESKQPERLVAMELDDMPDPVLGKGGEAEGLEAEEILAPRDDANRVHYSLEAFGGVGQALYGHFATPATTGLLFTIQSGFLAFDVQATFTDAHAQSQFLQIQEYDVGLLVGPRWDIVNAGPFILSAGARAGALWVRQSYTRAAPLPTSSDFAGLLTPVVRGQFDIPAGLFVSLEASARCAFVRETDNGGASSSHISVTPWGTVGLGYRW